MNARPTDSRCVLHHDGRIRNRLATGTVNQGGADNGHRLLLRPYKLLNGNKQATPEHAHAQEIGQLQHKASFT
jgi:hypothetical protein